MEKYNPVFGILNSLLLLLLLLSDITQFLVQLDPRRILQLINGISNGCKKLLQYFDGKAVFTCFNTPLLFVFP